MPHSDLWPKTAVPLADDEFNRLLKQIEPVFAGQLALEQLPISLSSELSRLYLPLAAWLNRQRPAAGILMVGLNGSQGSGKSTLCNLLKWLLDAAFDCRTCVISIDDLYLSKATRQQLATEIHPLLATRGVPGTHDIPLGLELFAQLKSAGAGTSVAVPRFNKASDDRRPQDEWDHCDGPVDLVLFEGWCVGANAQGPAELVAPLNRLEEREDADGTWRQYVNAQLEGPYRQLFGQLDLLLMLQIPGWEMVYHWRKRQEQQLAAKSSGAGIMGDTELRRFIMHYERLTRHQLRDLPKRAELVMALDEQQRVTALHLN